MLLISARHYIGVFFYIFALYKYSYLLTYLLTCISVYR